MKRPYKEEALRWLTQSKDEFIDADELRERGIPSRHFDDPKEAEEAMILAKTVLDLVESKIK